MKGENEENAILSAGDNGYLKIQKQVMSSNTPQKDMNQVKSKFDSNDAANLSYQTLD